MKQNGFLPFCFTQRWKARGALFSPPQCRLLFISSLLSSALSPELSNHIKTCLHTLHVAPWLAPQLKLDANPLMFRSHPHNLGVSAKGLSFKAVIPNHVETWTYQKMYVCVSLKLSWIMKTKQNYYTYIYFSLFKCLVLQKSSSFL